MALADRINALKDERAKILENARSDLEQLNRELAESNRLKDEFSPTSATSCARR